MSSCPPRWNSSMLGCISWWVLPPSWVMSVGHVSPPHTFAAVRQLGLNAQKGSLSQHSWLWTKEQHVAHETPPGSTFPSLLTLQEAQRAGVEQGGIQLQLQTPDFRHQQPKSVYLCLGYQWQLVTVSAVSVTVNDSDPTCCWLMPSEII